MAAHFLATTRVGRTRTMIVGLALVATACGGSSVTAENLSSSITDSTAPAVVDDSSDSAETDVATTDTPQDDTVVAPAESRDMTSVLAFAIEAAEQESFTFTQGLAINLGAAGVAPPATGPPCRILTSTPSLVWGGRAISSGSPTELSFVLAAGDIANDAPDCFSAPVLANAPASEPEPGTAPPTSDTRPRTPRCSGSSASALGP